ncbi:MAG: hypothetical protein OXK78_07590, partial [Caldilineaceae bacterium]|nr:hypothetical protein [Caldilineaceae bacterium]
RADLLKQPPLAELALDEIYANYVFPGYLASVKKIAAATAARKQAEESAERAEQQAAAAAAARRQAEEDKRALQAELARLRQQSS